VSGIAAVIRFDGGPAPSFLLEQLISAVPHRAVDGVTRWLGE